MYFACLTPIITFGGLLGAATDNNIVCSTFAVDCYRLDLSYPLAFHNVVERCPSAIGSVEWSIKYITILLLRYCHHVICLSSVMT